METKSPPRQRTVYFESDPSKTDAQNMEIFLSQIRDAHNSSRSLFSIDVSASRPSASQSGPFEYSVRRTSTRNCEVVYQTTSPWCVSVRGISAAVGRYVRFIFLRKGSMRFTTRGKTLSMEPGCIMFSDPAEPLTAVALTRSTMLSILLPADGFLAHSGFPMQSVLSMIFEPDSAVARLMKNITILVCDALGEVDARDADYLIAGLLEFMKPVLAQTVRNNAKQQTDSRQSLRDRAHLVMMKHIATPGITVEDIARELGISARYLGLIYSETGVTAKKYLLDLRLETARVVLHDSEKEDKTVSAVALAHGFRTAAHFCRCFKDRYGLSPKAWLAQNKSRRHGSD